MNIDNSSAETENMDVMVYLCPTELLECKERRKGPVKRERESPLYFRFFFVSEEERVWMELFSCEDVPPSLLLFSLLFSTSF